MSATSYSLVLHSASTFAVACGAIGDFNTKFNIRDSSEKLDEWRSARQVSESADFDSRMTWEGDEQLTVEWACVNGCDRVVPARRDFVWRDVRVKFVIKPPPTGVKAATIGAGNR